MNIGRYTIYPIEGGCFSLDGGALYGIIPKPLWEKTSYPDSLNRVQVQLRSLLLVGNGRKILVDTGMGLNWSEKSREIYNYNNTVNPIVESLKAYGFAAEDITDIILTHLHFDHTGGSVVYENGAYRPQFPRAAYYIQKKQFEWAQSPSDKDKGSFIESTFMPLMEANVLSLLDGYTRLDDEVELLIFNGHTKAQQLLRVFDNDTSLFYAGDLFPFAYHFKPPCIIAYDLDPLTTLKEKDDILRQAYKEGWIVFFQHDPKNTAVTIAKNEKGFTAKDIIPIG
ncbi:MBL fold metallo-hydrolase [Candidatus Magnetomonas plexicatena]|uniref:MBL fold metallo-hydrolase n=1 Tax=Candidatus Magnetomonas plexicatena TaxID=2552947 RepID=UPI001103DBCF|nr:MBL fold metallo-hydrolase [Nitrospirales bacterium LBB_01]